MAENHVEALSAKREKAIVKTSVVGIVTNIVLVAFKAAVGLVSNSIAIILDAVNNLSDALSSVITIIGAKLGAKKPNKKHPLGYGRIEYLSSMLVAGIVLYAGITSLVESVKKIIHPEKADYSIVSLIIVAVAIVVKLVLGRYVKKQGKKHNSGALVASGSDALFDAILSASVLASAPLHSYSGQCTYCGHCKPCPMDIDIAMVNKFYDLAVQQPSVPESVQAHYEALGTTASACIGCKGCESRCPFGVEVAERMQKTAALFGC